MSDPTNPYPDACDLLLFDTDEEWLEARKSYITASAAAAVLNKHPYKDRAEVIRSKLLGSDFVPNGRTWFGNQREACNIRSFEKLSGYSVGQDLNHCLLVNKKHPWMACTLDGDVTGKYLFNVDGSDLPPEELRLTLPNLPNGTVVEAKNVQSKSRSLWNKDKPHPRLFMYWAQVQYQMAVTEQDLGILFAAVDAAEMYAHVVPVDGGLRTKMTEASRTAMAEVEDLRF